MKSVGLNGVGTKAVNALSSSFYIESFRDGQSSWAKYERGILLDSGKKDGVSERSGTYVSFVPDTEMFGNYAFNMEYVETMVKNYSYLKKGLTLTLNGTSYKSENGLLDLVNERMEETPLYPPIHLEDTDIEIVLTHGNSYGENIASFVNGQNTRDGGTHLAAYREAIAKTLKDFFKKDYDPQDFRQGIVGAISIQMICRKVTRFSVRDLEVLHWILLHMMRMVISFLLQKEIERLSTRKKRKRTTSRR